MVCAKDHRGVAIFPQSVLFHFNSELLDTKSIHGHSVMLSPLSSLGQLLPALLHFLLSR